MVEGDPFEGIVGRWPSGGIGNQAACRQAAESGSPCDPFCMARRHGMTSLPPRCAAARRALRGRRTGLTAFDAVQTRHPSRRTPTSNPRASQNGTLGIRVPDDASGYWGGCQGYSVLAPIMISLSSAGAVMGGPVRPDIRDVGRRPRSSRRRGALGCHSRPARPRAGTGRPLVDSVKGSRHKNMKELRPGSTGRTEVRVLLCRSPTSATTPISEG